MADTPTKSDLKAVHKQAMDRADEAFTFERENIRQGREDQRFYAGDQWDEETKKKRGIDRPTLTINRLGTFVRQVTGDLRQNTPAVKVMPSGGKASQEKAEVFSGLIRSIEAKSDAPACYERGASNAAKAGQGWFRITTQYCNDKNFDQEICIEQGADPFGVLVDPFARRPDKSDMGYGFVLERYSKEAYKTKWPKAQSMDDFPVRGDGTGTHFQWMVGESVRVAEYWCKEIDKKPLYELDNGDVVDVLPKGKKAVRQRDVEVVSIVSYMMSGKEILSGPHPWAGKIGIPICFIPGEEETIDGATQRKGMVRDAKDAQRLVNYARSTEAEVVALQPKAPYKVAISQIKGFESIWKTAGTRNHPYLPYNVDATLGPNQAPQREQPPVMSTGLQSLSMTAGNDLHDIIGIYPANLGAKSNETSGVAIRARQHEGDTGSNYIPDNTRRAIAYCGRICVDLIPKIYDAERIVRLLKEDGTNEMAAINAMEPPAEDPQMQVIDSLDDGEYDVVVSTGKSYATRQEETADMLVQLASNMPQVGQVAPDLLVKALNFPGGDEIAKRLERTLPPQLLEDGPVQPPPPNPKDMASAAKDAATARKTEAEAEGQELENIGSGLQLMGVLQALNANVEAMKAQIAALGQPSMPGEQPQDPQMPPPDAMPPGPPVPSAPPMMNGADDGEGEIVDMQPIEGAPV